MRRRDHGDGDGAEAHRAAAVEADHIEPVLLLPEVHQVEDADDRDAELLGNVDGIRGVVEALAARVLKIFRPVIS